MSKSLLALLLSAVLISNACAKETNQSESTGVSAPVNEQTRKSESRDLVGEKRNAKYGLTVLFYKSKNQAAPTFENDNLFFDQLAIRQDKTNVESKPTRINASYRAAFQEVWSPNEEFLLLPGDVCGQDGFCIYKTVSIVDKFEKDSGFQTDEPFDFIKLTFTESEPKSERGKIKPCQHFLEKWSGEAGFIFDVKAYESKNGRGKFKYDLAQQKLSDGLERYTLDDEGFRAQNKKGKLEIVKE